MKSVVAVLALVATSIRAEGPVSLRLAPVEGAAPVCSIDPSKDAYKIVRNEGGYALVQAMCGQGWASVSELFPASGTGAGGSSFSGGNASGAKPVATAVIADSSPAKAASAPVATPARIEQPVPPVAVPDAPKPAEAPVAVRSNIDWFRIGMQDPASSQAGLMNFGQASADGATGSVNVYVLTQSNDLVTIQTDAVSAGISKSLFSSSDKSAFGGFGLGLGYSSIETSGSLYDATTNTSQDLSSKSRSISLLATGDLIPLTSTRLDVRCHLEVPLLYVYGSGSRYLDGTLTSNLYLYCGTSVKLGVFGGIRLVTDGDSNTTSYQVGLVGAD